MNIVTIPRQSTVAPSTKRIPQLVVKSVSVVNAYTVQTRTITEIILQLPTVIPAAMSTVCLPAVTDVTPQMKLTK